MQQTPFDHQNYRRITDAEYAWLDRHFPAVEEIASPRNAIEFGCGVGVFTKILTERGLDVLGLDLRPENVAEASRRHPGATFRVLDFDGCSDGDYDAVPMADLGFVYGVLYHLENPLGALRRMCGRAGRVVMISTRVAEDAANALVLHEEREGAAHNVRRVTAVPTLAAVVTGLELGGFGFVYRPDDQPSHGQWGDGFGNGRRHSLIAFRTPVERPGWRRLPSHPATRKWDPLPARAGASTTEGLRP